MVEITRTTTNISNRLSVPSMMSLIGMRDGWMMLEILKQPIMINREPRSIKLLLLHGKRLQATLGNLDLSMHLIFKKECNDARLFLSS